LNATITGALDIAPRLAAVELLFLCLWQSRFWSLKRQGFSGNPFDHGPWWSVTFFRIWAAWHLPVLLLQTGVSALFRKPSFAIRVPMVVVSFLLHAINLLLIVLVASLLARQQS
jgi:hypothetical protein